MRKLNLIVIKTQNNPQIGDILQNKRLILFKSISAMNDKKKKKAEETLRLKES